VDAQLNLLIFLLFQQNQFLSTEFFKTDLTETASLEC